MMTPSPKTGKLIATVFLTIFIFSTFIISGFTVTSLNHQFDYPLPPNGEPVTYRLENAIKNGGFEEISGDNTQGNVVATHWQSYQNGGAEFGWYDEQWSEAIHSGRHAQLLEIRRVESFRPNRVIAIYQTVDVIPNMHYLLTIHALMRSDAPYPLRNQGEYAMEWTIDYQGRGKYHYVTDWVPMDLTEQLRIGSSGPSDDNNHLFYQHITSTIFTGNTNRLTLWIRGMKIEPTGTELNFNVDDVSLVGPYIIPTATPTRPPSPTFTRRPTPTPTATITPTLVITPGLPTTGKGVLPDAGAVLPRNISAGALALGGLVLIVLGAGAAHSLLRDRKK
jgi:hypothetical protein